MQGEIEIYVEEADALTRPSDLLVLKYAQHLFGLDAKAVRTAAINEADLPGVAGHFLTAARPAVLADRLLFVGTRPISSFDYRDVREFAMRALSIAGKELPQTREICLTLHGAGFGLDETEAFEAELGGLIDAISAGNYPESLLAVAFLEQSQQRAARMKETLKRLLPRGRIEAVRPFGPESVDSASANHLRSVGFDSSAKSHAFVAMPFSEQFEDTFHFGIAPPIHAAGLLCERMDKVAFTGDIGFHMRGRIGDAQLVVAELTGANPNVYLEVGYAWGRGVPTILICEQSARLEFDVQGHRCLFYTSIRDLEVKLRKEIPLLL